MFCRHSPVVTYPQQRETQQTSPVLLVDATGHHKSPDLAEVPVVTGIIKSPVRVVCHSPRSVGRNRNGLENSSLFQRSDNVNTVTGHVESGRRVKVAGVPSVNLLGSSARKGDPSPSHFSPGLRSLIKLIKILLSQSSLGSRVHAIGSVTAVLDLFFSQIKMTVNNSSLVKKFLMMTMMMMMMIDNDDNDDDNW